MAQQHPQHQLQRRRWHSSSNDSSWNWLARRRLATTALPLPAQPLQMRRQATQAQRRPQAWRQPPRRKQQRMPLPPWSRRLACIALVQRLWVRRLLRSVRLPLPQLPQSERAHTICVLARGAVACRRAGAQCKPATGGVHSKAAGLACCRRLQHCNERGTVKGCWRRCGMRGGGVACVHVLVGGRVWEAPALVFGPTALVRGIARQVGALTHQPADTAAARVARAVCALSAGW